MAKAAKETTKLSIRDKIKKNSTIKSTASFSDSTVFTSREIFSTTVPMVNVALSGDVKEGMKGGILEIAGPSRHFKTLFGVLLASAFLKKHPNGQILFYVSEFGSPESYFKAFGIDLDQITITPVMDIEQLKFDITTQLQGFERGDEVMILIDSIGNLASRKEIEDAVDQNVVADFTRSKALKSLFRIVTPHFAQKEIPCVIINHTYKTMEKFSRDVVSGGTGSIYSSDAIWIIGRQQDKDDKVLEGYNFIINIEKSRYVKEKSKIPIEVSFTKGINRWSGLFDLAVEAGLINQTGGWYSLCDMETGEVLDTKFRRDDMERNKEFWLQQLQNDKFVKYIRDQYRLSEGEILGNEEKRNNELDVDVDALESTE